MTFARVRQPGGWTMGSAIDPSEMEAFDDHQSNAIDGRHGGAYAPDVQLEIGGAGLKVSTSFQCVGGASSAQIESLSVTNIGLFENLTVNDGLLTVAASADAVFNGTSTFNGTATFKDGLHVDVGTALFDEALTVGGLATLGALICGPAIIGDTQLDGKLQLNGTGRIQYRVANGGDADATFSASTCDRVDAQGVVFTANRFWSIDSAAAEIGGEMTIDILGATTGGNVVTVRRASDGATLIILDGTNFNWVKLVYIAGNWQARERGR